MTDPNQLAHIRDPQTLRKIEDALSVALNAVHGNAVHDRTPIKVKASAEPIGMTKEQQKDLQDAQMRNAERGLKTGPLTEEELAARALRIRTMMQAPEA
jgi:hypothetical protein